jgi:hypothetical protein
MRLNLNASRRALADAKAALELFKRSDIDFQLAWVLNVCFLDIIPSIIQTVDKNASDDDARKLIDKIWEENRKIIKLAKGIRKDVLHYYKELYEGNDTYTHDVFEEGLYEARRYKKQPFKDRHPANAVQELIAALERMLDEIEAIASTVRDG